MISSKILCRRPRRSLCEEVLEETSRRKKSGGQLYVNGYRVRQGPGQGRELQGEGLLCTILACLRFLGGWGKGLRLPRSRSANDGYVITFCVMGYVVLQVLVRILYVRGKDCKCIDSHCCTSC